MYTLNELTKDKNETFKIMKLKNSTAASFVTVYNKY